MTGPMWLACRDWIILKTFRLEAGCLHHSTFGRWNNSLVRTSKLSISGERSKTQVTRGGEKRRLSSPPSCSSVSPRQMESLLAGYWKDCQRFWTNNCYLLHCFLCDVSHERSATPRLKCILIFKKEKGPNLIKTTQIAVCIFAAVACTMGPPYNEFLS